MKLYVGSVLYVTVHKKYLEKGELIFVTPVNFLYDIVY